MKIFITASYRGLENKNEVEHLCNLVRQAGSQDFCFVRDVEHYQDIFPSGREVMVAARSEIDKCDALLFDASEKSTVRAIETGIAYGMGKKIITIAKKGTVLKDTLIGISDLVIEYDNIDDIKEPLSNFLK